MKTPIFFLAALVAFFVFPIDFTTAVSGLFASGLTAMVVTDYRRSRPSLAAVAAPSVARSARERLRLAA